jgi:hypothetical protein
MAARQLPGHERNNLESIVTADRQRLCRQRKRERGAPSTQVFDRALRVDRCWSSDRALAQGIDVCGIT